MSPLELVSLTIPRRHLQSLRWLFLSQQGRRALPNPRVTFRRFLGDEFWDGSEPVFGDYFWFNRGSYCWPIHASPLESVSFTISETGMAQFSLTVSKSIGAGCAEESTCHLWNLFRWWFPSCHRLSFRWLFLSQQGLRALPNPRVTFQRFLGDDF